MSPEPGVSRMLGIDVEGRMAEKAEEMRSVLESYSRLCAGGRDWREKGRLTERLEYMRSTGMLEGRAQRQC